MKSVSVHVGVVRSFFVTVQQICFCEKGLVRASELVHTYEHHMLERCMMNLVLYKEKNVVPASVTVGFLPAT